MFPYIFIFLLLLTLAYKFELSRASGNQQIANSWRVIVILLLILFSGLRNRVGGDTIVYMSIFEDYPTLWEIEEIEFLGLTSQPLWYLINVILKTIVDDFLIVQIFHAILFNLLLYRYVCKKTEYYFTVITFVYCILWWNCSFEILRESLSVVILLNASLYLEQGKLGKFILISLPAIFIHTFAIIMVIFFIILYYCKISTVIGFCVLGSIVFLVLPQGKLIEYMVLIGGFGGEDVLTKVDDYLNYSRFGTASANIFGLAHKMLLLLLPLLVATGIQEKDSFEKKMIILYMFFYFVETYFPIFTRFKGYLTLPLIICSINYLYNRRGALSLNYIGIALLLTLYTYNSVQAFLAPDIKMREKSMKYDCRYIPYKSIFQEPDPIRETYYGK